jgi:hypothetical protein
MVETTESVWVLAHYAGVTAPDSETSPGAEFLLRVARSCQETVKWASEPTGPCRSTRTTSGPRSST